MACRRCSHRTQSALEERTRLSLLKGPNARGAHEEVPAQRSDADDDSRGGESTQSDLEVSVWSETEVPATSTAPAHALRLLARLLVRAAAAGAAPTTDPQIPLDVAAASKVRLDPE